MSVDYAKAIKMSRAARGLSQKETAARAKINANYLSLLESGNRNPSTDTVQAIAGALGIPVWALVVLGSDDVPPETRGIALSCLAKG